MQLRLTNMNETRLVIAVALYRTAAFATTMRNAVTITSACQCTSIHSQWAVVAYKTSLHPSCSGNAGEMLR